MMSKWPILLMILRTGFLFVGSSFFIDFGSKHAKTCKTIYSITTWAPKQNRTIWPFFAWPPCLLQNESSCAHGFAWPKKKVPYKRTPGFYKINKSYKNTARLQKHVPKMGLGIQFLIEIQFAKALKHSLLVEEILTSIFIVIYWDFIVIQWDLEWFTGIL